MTSNKIFIIGLPRTGTTSICAALLDLGFNVAHTAYTQRTFEQAQVIADTPVFNDFELLDSYYPNSKFIYLSRELKLWLPSIEQLLQRMAKNLLRADGGFNPIIKRCYFNTFSPFTAQNISSSEFLTQCYQHHQRKVAHHFKDTPEKVLTIDISESNAFEKLQQFLNLQPTDAGFKKMNVGGKVTAWKDLNHHLKIASTNNGRASNLDYFNNI